MSDSDDAGFIICEKEEEVPRSSSPSCISGQGEDGSVFFQALQSEGACVYVCCSSHVRV